MRAFGDSLRLSPSDLSNFLGCRHRTGLDLAVARGLLDRPHWTDAFAEALRTRGAEHERAFVGSLRAHGLSIADLRGEDSPSRARESLASGVDVVVQAPLEGDDWFGYADILRRVETPSALGHWSYEVYDTKLARDTRGGTILQLSVYSELVAGLQGVAPVHFHVVTPPGATIHTYRADDYAAYYRLMKQKLLDTVALESEVICEKHYPERVEQCEMCRWWQRCNTRRRADDHLSFIAGISRLHREELVGQGYSTLAAAALMIVPLAFKPARGAKATYQKLREQARVQLAQRESGQPVYELLDIEPEKGLCRLPEPSRGDLFLDLEGDPFAREGGREYLFGLGDADGTYRSWWAFDDGQERSAFEAAIDFIMRQWEVYSEMHVYHFGHYEPSAMKRLMGRYALKAEHLDRLLRGGRFVDLHAIVRHALRAGVESYSIKKLEPFYAFARDVPLDDAALNLRTIELALESQAPSLIPEQTKNAVEGYNRDDCRSTVGLRDWLESLRAGVVTKGTDVPRLTPQDDAPKDKTKALDQEVEVLRARLLDGVPAAASERSPEQHVWCLLAYLIDWHRREEKADWWEFFRLCEMAEEELLDERKAIAGLEYVGNLGVVRNRKTGNPTGSIIQRYTYPNQDVDLRKDDTLKIQTGDRWGTVESIDRDTRRLDVKKPEEAADDHPTCVFNASVVPTETVQRSVMRLATAFLDGERNCATDLLFRLTPRLRDTAFATQPRESVVEFATRIGPELNRTMLPIQGPPGAGKTYTGGRMICALVARGIRVGVTGPSHKVIRNLLEATLKEAAKSGARVRVGQKVAEATGAGAITEFTDNDDALASLASRDVDVLGGTPWLWSCEDAAGVADVLFVDEAGQMSLANVVAVSQAAGSVVLLGDPQQLDQPTTASHPDGIGISALDHVLEGAQTMPPERGLFLPNTWRMAPAICGFTSEVFYEGKLQPKPGLEKQRLIGAPPFDGAGLWWIPVDHDGNQSSSTEEVEVVARAVERLLSPGAQWSDEHDVARQLTASDLRIVAPYNAQVNRIAERLEKLASCVAAAVVPVGTVDKFQGQEAPVVIYSMTTSRPEDAPKGMEFLFSLNRLNVATSRARCAVILIASPRLFEPDCRTPRQMQLANALCRYRELAHSVVV